MIDQYIEDNEEFLDQYYRDTGNTNLGEYYINYKLKSKINSRNQREKLPGSISNSLLPDEIKQDLINKDTMDSDFPNMYESMHNSQMQQRPMVDNMSRPSNNRMQMQPMMNEGPPQNSMRINSSNSGNYLMKTPILNQMQQQQNNQMQRVQMSSQSINKVNSNFQYQGNMNPNMNNAMKSGMGAGMQTNMNMGMQSNMNSGMNTGMNSNLNSGMNSNMSSGMNQSMNLGMNPNMNSGMNTGINPNMGSGMNQNMNSGMQPNMSQSMPPNMRQSMGQNMPQNMNQNARMYGKSPAKPMNTMQGNMYSTQNMNNSNYIGQSQSNHYMRDKSPVKNMDRDDLMYKNQRSGGFIPAPNIGDNYIMMQNKPRSHHSDDSFEYFKQ